MNGYNINGTILNDARYLEELQLLSQSVIMMYAGVIFLFFLFKGFLMYRIAERAGCENSWMAFVPGGGYYLRMKITNTYQVTKFLLIVMTICVALMLLSLSYPSLVMLIYVMMVAVTLPTLMINDLVMDYKLYEMFGKPGFLVFAFLFGVGGLVRLVVYSVIAFEKK